MKEPTSKEAWEEEFDRIFVTENVWQGEDEYTKNVPIGNIKSFITQLLISHTQALIEEVERMKEELPSVTMTAKEAVRHNKTCDDILALLRAKCTTTPIEPKD